MGTAFLILGTTVLGTIVLAQAMQIAKLSKKLFSEYVTGTHNKTN